MSGIIDIFMGDPIYDNQNRIVRREFGVKNVIAIAVVLYVGNVLMGQMKPKSGQRKMGGAAGYPFWYSPWFWQPPFGLIFSLIVGIGVPVIYYKQKHSEGDEDAGTWAAWIAVAMAVGLTGFFQIIFFHREMKPQ